MEKTERTKYYNIGLQNKKLHTEFMILGRKIGSKNVDETMSYLLNREKITGFFLPQCQKMLLTEEDIDALGIHQELKDYLKKFACTEEEKESEKLNADV